MPLAIPAGSPGPVNADMTNEPYYQSLLGYIDNRPVEEDYRNQCELGHADHQRAHGWPLHYPGIPDAPAFPGS